MKKHQVPPVQGNIKAYSSAVNAGLIRGDDGKTYQFSRQEWTGGQLPVNDGAVSFDADGGHAKRVKDTSKNTKDGKRAS